MITMAKIHRETDAREICKGVAWMRRILDEAHETATFVSVPILQLTMILDVVGHQNSARSVMPPEIDETPRPADVLFPERRAACDTSDSSRKPPPKCPGAFGRMRSPSPVRMSAEDAAFIQQLDMIRTDVHREAGVQRRVGEGTRLAR